MSIREDLLRFVPCNEQEAEDRDVMLNCLDLAGERIFLRDCKAFHFAVSAFVFNKSFTINIQA